jgi:hypothetical protein
MTFVNGSIVFRDGEVVAAPNGRALTFVPL